ncbi:MAG: hypothetical protein Kow0025_11840 [Thermodesulfovibrionales bacterium]
MSVSLAAAGGGKVEVRRKGAVDAVVDPELAEALSSALALRERAEEVERELAERKALIAERARRFTGEAATVTFAAGGVACRVARRFEAEVPEGSVGALRRLLGGRFRDLVRTKTRRMATKALLEEAARRGDLAGHIAVRELSPQFTFSRRQAASGQR